MFRNEIQEKTGLTRKAINYYEEKGLINPLKLENGYRDYSDEDLEILNKISLFRKIGLSISEIDECLSSNGNALPSMLRKIEHRLDIEQKRKDVIELIVKKESQDKIYNKIALIEAEETIYEKLTDAFPGYFGQLIFSSYQSFFDETLLEEEKDSFKAFVSYLDDLPLFKLSKDEQDYIETVSSDYNMRVLKEINTSKIEAIDTFEEWFEENKDRLGLYLNYKNSEEYQNSMTKTIQDKLQRYMEDNKYYEIAIPLIRKFSKTYNDYYQKLLIANDKYLKLIKSLKF